MKTLRMRLASLLMIVCILTGVFASSVCVQAADTTWEEVVDLCQFGLTTTKYLLTSTFGFFTQDLDGYIANNKKYWQYAKDFQDRWDAKEEGQKEIEVTKEELQGLYDIAKGDITALNGYYLFSSTFDKEGFYKDVKATLPAEYTDNFYKGYNSLSDNFVVLRSNGNMSYAYGFLDDFDYSSYYYLDKNAVRKYGEDTNIFPTVKFQISYSTYSNEYYGCYLSQKWSVLTGSAIYQSYGAPFKLFYSKLDLLNYLNGGQGSYQGSNFNMPVLSGNTLNIDASKVQDTDWDKVNKSIYDSVSDAIADAGGWGNVDEAQKQEIIDSKMNDILGSLGEIGDNTGQSNALLSSIKDILKSMQKTLEDIYMDSGDTAWKNAISGHLKDIIAALTNISSSSKISAEHLFDIKGKVQVLHDKFSDFNFEKLLETIKDSGGGGGSIADSAVGTIIGSFISDLLEKVMNGDETAEDAVSILVTRFSKLVDVSKTKFPFSLPWDVVVIFETLSHEPETPVIDFPIKVASVGFDYTIHIDMKDFESLSKMCRAFFALTFALVLIKLTLLMINRGDLDA